MPRPETISVILSYLKSHERQTWGLDGSRSLYTTTATDAYDNYQSYKTITTADCPFVTGSTVTEVCSKTCV